MTSLFDYIEEYGNKDFIEEEFNEVDNIILSALSYINFKNIVSQKRDYKSLKDVGIAFFDKYTPQEITEEYYISRQAIKLFQRIRHYKRYQNLLLSNYVYKKTSTTQFSAISIKINKKLTYIAFEGTDEIISGWKEDFELAYKFPVKAQTDAINYLKNNIRITDKNIIIGGHSKGGNLALIASMYAPFWIRPKIKKIYSNDGPGILKEQLYSKKLKKITRKYIHIIPAYSIVGLLLLHPNNDVVIQTTRKGILAHDFLSWETEDNRFATATLSSTSKRFKNISAKWLAEYTPKQKENFVEEVFAIFKNENIDSLLDFKEKSLKDLLSLIKESNNIDDSVKEMLKDLLILTVKDYTASTKEVIKDTLKESKKILDNII